METTRESELAWQREAAETVNPEVDIVCRPGEVVPWEKFCDETEYPGHTIGLDGYVAGPSNFVRNPSGIIKVNFDHHQKRRLDLHSTCGQVLIHITQGLMDNFRGKKVHAYVNDTDPDTTLSVWLLKHHRRVEGVRYEPRISELVHAEDLLDATAGAYPFDVQSPLLKKMAYIFDPYVQRRLRNNLHLLTAEEMHSLVGTCCQRIDRYLALGDASPEIDLDTRYEHILGGGGPGWAMIKEIGYWARTRLFNEGIRAFVSVRDMGDGTFVYSLGKMSPYEKFPLEDFYSDCNAEDGVLPGDHDRWNGGDTIGGPPRMRRTRITPVRLTQIINERLQKLGIP
ncbi:hypothetical protein HYS30_02175 [Candidatus Peregrinibacteria bacterium]|nr:hypothetical protein [Candidatus Peregrinibacteria bacterium]MBI2523635.1 hypothetical protein [Candidatus Peregrinibacteria bacterium]